MTVKADPSERLVPAPNPAAAAGPRRRFAALFAICFLLHAALLALLLYESGTEADKVTQEEEIPVEVVAEMPPEPKVEPPTAKAPRPPELLQPPPVKPKPPPEKVELEDVPVAHDAPKAGDSAKTKKGEPDKPTQGPRVAPSTKPEKAEKDKRAPDEPPPSSKEAAVTPTPQSAPEKLAEDKPDAEALDKAQPQPQANPSEKQASVAAKTPPGQGKQMSVAEQLAAVTPAPTYTFGSSAKSAPIAGGTEKTSYESVVFGMILRKYQRPPRATGHPIGAFGLIRMYIDDLGNLTHQVIYRASGDPSLDTRWLMAVQRAAPFPAPPRGLPHAFILSFSNKEND